MKNNLDIIIMALLAFLLLIISVNSLKDNGEWRERVKAEKENV